MSTGKYLREALPLDMENLPRSRFFSKLAERPSGCLEWIGRIGSDGYGTCDVLGKPIRAHRLAWAIFRGEDPGRRLVCHTCDNPRCVREEHLFLGTYRDNARDCLQKGRHASFRPEGPGVIRGRPKRGVVAPGRRKRPT